MDDSTICMCGHIRGNHDEGGGCRAQHCACRGFMDPPKLTPIGNLRDLLAGGGSGCDGGSFEPGSNAPRDAC